MMNIYGNYITNLIAELSRLPGIGSKSAQRIAFHIINMPNDKVECLANTILQTKKNIKYCSICCNIGDQDPCHICRNPKRDASVIMIVEGPKDMAAYERTREFKGLYHVLHGAISPLNGIGPDNITLKDLLSRIDKNDIKEIIIATNPNVEGEATAMYINKLLKSFKLRVTRIAYGVPIGGDLEHIDEITLSRALEGRIEI